MPLVTEKPAQGFRLAVVQPGDIADPPLFLDLDEIERDGSGLAPIGELYLGARPAGRLVAHLDVEI